MNFSIQDYMLRQPVTEKEGVTQDKNGIARILAPTNITTSDFPEANAVRYMYADGVALIVSALTFNITEAALSPGMKYSTVQAKPSQAKNAFLKNFLAKSKYGINYDVINRAG